MKTNSLLLAGLVSLAGVVAADAQTTVYSVNSVGFVNVPIEALKFKMIANPLDKEDNSLASILPTVPNGTNLYLFDKNAGGYQVHLFDDSLGWFQIVAGSPVLTGTTAKLRGGEGAFIFSPDAFTLVFSGEVRQNSASNVTFGEGFQILSSPVATPVTISTLNNTAGGTFFNVANGDQIYKWNAASPTGGYSVYIYDESIGWFELVGGAPQAVTATIDVAESFFYFGAIGEGQRTWNRNFSVSES